MTTTYFILGTDTNCGKTYVTCQLLRYFQARKRSVHAIKPIASGCVVQNDTLINDDILQLEHYNANKQIDICPWRFKLPISPHLAAEVDGHFVTAQEVIGFCNEQISTDLDYLLIEGAGGLMVPMNTDETWVDVLVPSKMPVILVVGMRLGCINHALLTAVALKTYGIACVGWIANCLDENMLMLSENIQTLSDKMEWPLLATVPFMGEISGELPKGVIY